MYTLNLTKILLEKYLKTHFGKNVAVSVSFDRRTRHFIAYCQSLEISGYGKKPPDAYRMLKEVTLY